MSKKIDQIGTYRGEVFEAALQLNRNGNPMFVINVRADQKYVEDANDLQFYVDQGVIEEAVPQWVDWSAYDESARNFMTLYNCETEDGEFSEENATSNYEQVVKAFGWDGSSFESFQDGSFIGKSVLFRVKEEPDERYGPTTVCWVDAYDADPTRALKNVDKTTVLDLDKRLKGAKKTAPKAAAAPKVAATKPKAAPKAAPAKTKKAPAPAASTPPAPAPKVADAVEFTKEEAWEDVFKQIPNEEPDVITDTWIAAVAEVGDNNSVEEADFTSEHWGAVHKLVLRDLGVVAAS